MNFIKIKNKSDECDTIVNLDNVAYINQDYDFQRRKNGSTIYFIDKELDTIRTDMNLLSIENSIKKLKNQKG